MAEQSMCPIKIPASDRATVSRIYAAVFGWQMQDDPASNYHTFQPQRGAGGAFVTAEETTGHQIGQVLNDISTDDNAATLATAEAHRATTLTPKTEIPFGWFAVFADPSGNRIALFTAPSHSS